MTGTDGPARLFRARHALLLVCIGVVLLYLLIALLQLLEQGDVSGWLEDAPDQWAYVLVFLLVWFDAIIPIFPGETTLNAASTMAANGELVLGYVIVAGALGAIVGDSSLFWIARKSGGKVRQPLDKALERPKVKAAWAFMDRSAALLIVAGRFVPGMRFAVNAAMGLSDIPYRRFLPWSVVGGVVWSAYTCVLAYLVGTALSGYPTASIVVSGLVTTAALAAIFVVGRRRMAHGASGAADEDPPAGGLPDP